MSRSGSRPTAACAHAKATISVRLRKGDASPSAIRRPRGGTSSTRSRTGVSCPRGRAAWRLERQEQAGGARPRRRLPSPRSTSRTQHRTILLPNRDLARHAAAAGRARQVDLAAASRRTATGAATSSDPLRVRLARARGLLPERPDQVLYRPQPPAEGERRVLARDASTALRCRRARTSSGSAASTSPATRTPVVRSGSPCSVRIRYIQLRGRTDRRARRRVRSSRSAVGTDAKQYRWKLGAPAAASHSGPVLRFAHRSARAVHARALGARPHRSCPRSSSGAGRVSDLARIGGPVACLGLAVLLTARGRGDRLAGLGFAAFGARAARGRRSRRRARPASSRRSARGRARRRAAARGSSSGASRGSSRSGRSRLRRRARPGSSATSCSSRSTRRRSARAVLLGWQLAARRRALARAAGSCRWPLAALRRLDGRSRSLWTSDVHAGRDRAARLLRPVLRPRARARAAAVERRAGCGSSTASWRRWRSSSPRSASTSTRRATSSRTRR